VHEEVDHALGFSWKMGAPRGQGIGSGGERGIWIFSGVSEAGSCQKMRQRHGTETTARPAEELPTVGRQWEMRKNGLHACAGNFMI
jgi:hypothetical protein